MDNRNNSRYTIKNNTIDPITPPTSFLNAAEGWVIEKGTLTGVAGYKKLFSLIDTVWNK
jgi:hypothetical protein